LTERGIAHRTRVHGRRSVHSSRGSHAPPGKTGEPSTGRRDTGGRIAQRERVRDARIPEPSGCPSTGELIDAETVTISSERGGWKSAYQVTRRPPTRHSSPVRRGAVGKGLRKMHLAGRLPTARPVRREAAETGPCGNRADRLPYPSNREDRGRGPKFPARSPSGFAPTAGRAMIDP